MGFQQGLSGLNVASKALDVVGNNIANSGTVGFKSAGAQFGDVYAAALTGSGASPVGAGASLLTIAQQFTQGNLTTTNNPLDLGINGGGFYQMSDNGALTYSRNGQFTIDKNGYMVNSAGRFLQGYVPATPGGPIVQSAPANIFIDPSDINPQVTTKLIASANLDSRNTVPVTAFPTVPNATGNNVIPTDAYNGSTSLQVYDTLGNPHEVTLYFVKTAVVPATGGTTWDVYANVDGTSAQNVDLGLGAGQPATIAFSTSGLPTDINGTGSTAAIAGAKFDLTAVDAELNAATPAPATPYVNGANQFIDFSNGIDLSGFTQFGSSFGVNQLTQDGYSSGHLAGTNISSDGIIQGSYTNGQSRNLAQIVLAKFTNPNGLQSLGGNQWQPSSASGQPLIGAPGSGSNGVIQSASIEESNVDLTTQLVNLITEQRAYQANSQTIKTQDSVLQTLVNLG